MAKAKYKKGTDGYFQAKVWDGSYVNGVKHRITLRTGVSSRKLENLVIEHNELLKNREYVRATDMNFFEYAKKWREVYKTSVEENTIAMYNNIIAKHLCSIQCNIGDVNRMHYHVLINNIPGDRTKQQASMTFKQIIRSAIKDKLLPPIALDDIFDNSTKINYKAPEKRALTEHEKRAVFSAELLPPDKAFILILYGCGLRRGEALALTRFDVSVERHEVTVNKAIAYKDNNPYIKTTKSTRGNRTVPIPDIIYPLLCSYVQSLNGTLLFPSSAGSHITKSSYVKKWERILKALDAAAEEPIEGLTAHIFRHNYCASLCYMMPSISMRKIAELLGDTEKMVTEVYNHVIEKKEQPHEVVCSALAI